MKRAVVVVAVVAVIAVTMSVGSPSAWAKGAYTARVCGATECRVVEFLPAFGRGGAAPVDVLTEPPPAAHYRIEITFDRAPNAPLRLMYVPEHQMVDFNGWKKVGPRFVRGMRRMLRGVAPFPPRRERASGPPAAVRTSLLGGEHADVGASRAIVLGAVMAALAALAVSVRRRRRGT